MTEEEAIRAGVARADSEDYEKDHPRSLLGELVGGAAEALVESSTKFSKPEESEHVRRMGELAYNMRAEQLAQQRAEREKRRNDEGSAQVDYEGSAATSGGVGSSSFGCLIPFVVVVVAFLVIKESFSLDSVLRIVKDLTKSGDASNMPPPPPPPVIHSYSPTLEPVSPPLSPGDIITARGIGALKVGMTLTEAAGALGDTLLVNSDGEGSDCYSVKPTNKALGITLMASGATITRIEIAQSTWKTKAGISVGDPQEALLAAYGERAQIFPNRYDTAWHDIELMPLPDEEEFRVLFTTNERGLITEIRVGYKREVELVEECS